MSYLSYFGYNPRNRGDNAYGSFTSWGNMAKYSYTPNIMLSVSTPVMKLNVGSPLTVIEKRHLRKYSDKIYIRNPNTKQYEKQGTVSEIFNQGYEEDGHLPDKTFTILLNNGQIIKINTKNGDKNEYYFKISGLQGGKSGKTRKARKSGKTRKARKARKTRKTRKTMHK
jgi:hypothetical protein